VEFACQRSERIRSLCTETCTVLNLNRSKIVSKDAAQNSVTSSVPKGTEEANINAFQKGFDYGLAILKGREKKAAGQTGAIA
jgi:hypothetical protein